MIGRVAADGDGGHGNIIKDRFLGFLIWQSLQSSLIYFLSKTLVSPSFSILSFLFFHLSLLLFSSSLFLLSSPQPLPGVSPAELFFALLKLIFLYGGQPLPHHFRRRVTLTFRFLLFLASSAFSAFLALVCLSGSLAFGLRALLLGFIYASHYIFTRRWVLDFPILQRPLFFSYKMGIRKAVLKAVSLSSAGYLLSLLLPIFVSDSKVALRDLVFEQIVFYLVSCVVFLCWELNRHLLQVFLTRRYLFAPPKGSAAAATNPSDHLLAALEEMTGRSLVRHLAYLDLCMVSESNVDTWRRAAFFEETGETYKKVIAVCLKPLEHLTLDLSEGLGSSLEKSTFLLSHQLHSSAELSSVSRLHEPFYDFQLLCGYVCSYLRLMSGYDFGAGGLTLSLEAAFLSIGIEP